jgi:hypothetical protein
LGLDVYLYGLVVISWLNLLFNLVYCQREIGLPVYYSFKIIFEQAVLAICSVFGALWVTSFVSFGLVTTAILQWGLVLLTFVAGNFVVKSESWVEVKTVVKPLFERF